MTNDSIKEQLERDLATWPNRIYAFMFVAIGLFLFVVVFYFVCFNNGISHDQAIWGQFGDFLGGVLNPLFSVAAFIGLLITITLQLRALKISSDELELTRTELEKTASANQTIAEDNKANAIVDLYQIYTNDYFYKLSVAAWQILEVAVKDSDYCKFLVTTFFVTEYKNPRIANHSLVEKIKTHLQLSDGEDARVIENDYRHRLDEMINFFNIIALRKAPQEVFERCDFFYDWYRPLLWWIADLRLASYLRDEQKQKYCTRPFHQKGLERLDQIYGFPLQTRAERWADFKSHPLVLEMGLDSRHNFPFEGLETKSLAGTL